MFSLINGNLEKPYVLEAIDQKTEAGKHLANLGFAKGADVMLLSSSGENYIVLVRESRIALTKEVVASMLVVEKSEAEGAEWQALDGMKSGQYGKVKNILGQGAVRRRLMDMGLTKGVDILVRKVAPFGDPVEINIRGYELTLRKEEASMILVENIEG